MGRRRKKSPPSDRSRQRVAADQVHRELIEGQSTALLRELHLLTRRGDLNADARRKLKQINHYCGQLRPHLQGMLDREGHDPVLLDVGAGNAYLGFILYEVFLQAHEHGHVVNVERRSDLTERARERAQRLGFERMHFIEAEMADLALQDERLPWSPTGAVDAVISLHACDTATDDAIVAGVQTGAEFIALVPCCQTEVFNLLQGQGKGRPTQPLWRHPWHRREFGAHLTNVIRALALESCGYKVRVTELAGWEHSLKNELILAKRHQRSNGAARRQLEELLAELPALEMGLLRRLGLSPASADSEES